MDSTRRQPRILISRLSAIGDAVLTLPIAGALRQRYPDAYLGWIVESKAAPVVRNHAALDAVIEVPRGWFTSPAGILQTRGALREHGFDTSIDCQGNTKSAMAGFLAGARRRIGYAGRHATELSGLLNNVRIRPVLTHLTDRSLELLSPLEIHDPSIRWDLPVPAADRTWAKRLRAALPADRIAVINPGGTWPSKLWETDRFADTARYLADRYGYQSLVVWGTLSERLMAEEIVVAADGAARLAPETTLLSLAAVIEQCDLFISGDTGPLHMAVAVGTPTIGLYGATRPGDSGPYGAVALQNKYEAGSRRHRRRATNRAMRAIGVQHVCQIVDRMHAGVTSVRIAA